MADGEKQIGLITLNTNERGFLHKMHLFKITMGLNIFYREDLDFLPLPVLAFISVR